MKRIKKGVTPKLHKLRIKNTGFRGIKAPRVGRVKNTAPKMSRVRGTAPKLGRMKVKATRIKGSIKVPSLGKPGSKGIRLGKARVPRGL